MERGIVLRGWLLGRGGWSELFFFWLGEGGVWVRDLHLGRCFSVGIV